jgi:hypothetical protein
MFENQSGERRILLLGEEWGTNAQEPGPVYLRSIGFKTGSTDWLFVSCVPRLAWNIPVLTVTGNIFKDLLSHVESDFTQDCNALPPVFIRISLATRSRNSATISLVTSSSVKALSFDALAFQPRWAAGSAGVSGKVVLNNSQYHDAPLNYNLAAGTRVMLVKPDVGVKFFLYSTTEGSQPTAASTTPPNSPWNEQRPPVLSEYESFALNPAELSRLEKHVSSAIAGTSVFISVRYAGKWMYWIGLDVVRVDVWSVCIAVPDSSCRIGVAPHATPYTKKTLR